jgi:signal transduction histidine kinase
MRLDKSVQLEKRKLLLGIVVPVAVMLVAFAATILVFFVITANQISYQDKKHETQVIDSAVRHDLERLAKFVGDYAWWDEFHLAFKGTPSEAWIDPEGNYLGQYLGDQYDVSDAFVYREGEGLIYAWAAASDAEPGGVVLADEPALQKLIARALAEPVRNATVSVSEIMTMQGGIHLASASRVEPSSEDLRAGMAGPRLVFVALTDLGAAQTAALGQDFGIRDLSISDEQPASQRRLAVVGHDGETLGYLTWNGPESVYGLLWILVPIAMSSIGLLLLVTVWFSRGWIGLAGNFQRIQASADAAQAASQAKSAFIANMSHELRTPLNAIIGFSEVIQTQAFGPGQVNRYRSYAGDINTSGRHLLQLINDVLTVAKLEAGQYPLSRDAVCVADIAETVAKELTPQLRARGMALELHDLARPLCVVADGGALFQAMLKLAGNAIKFGRPGGIVTLSWAEAARPGFTAIEVRDDGAGIDQSEIPLLGTPFHQVAQVYTRREGGMGVGLSIALGFVEAMGGTMTIASKVGDGTTVTLTLPSAERDVAHQARAA